MELPLGGDFTHKMTVSMFSKKKKEKSLTSHVVKCSCYCWVSV